ncbi:MAG: DUF1080 domain-containing protein [Planctomycetes bacterium]|nr:DUF1080 domain-containing protein [Planctomycetota bacterium]
MRAARLLARLAMLSGLGVLSAGCRSTTGEPWRDLFDGRTLAGFAATDYGGQGDVVVRDGRLHLGIGSPLTGVTWTGPLPHGDYELELVARRVLGVDFFAALTFPVASDCLTLVFGGWGGSVGGLSCLDGADASRNATRRVRAFPNGTDARLSLRVVGEHVTVHVDGEPWIDADLRGQRRTLRPEVELSRPLGLASYASEGAVSVLRWRPLVR